MSFGQAVSTCFSKYVGFSGRARRSEYWWFYLFCVIVYVIAYILDTVTKTPIFAVIVGLGLLLPALGAGIRRLHDTNRSGWWLLISLIPIVGTIILIVFLATDTVHGPNQYGPEPA